MASTDSLPVPRKNAAYRLTFGLFKSDGTLITGATGLDSEVSKDAGTFGDCTNEATEIATSSGIYYLDLTSTEMNADTVCVLVKSSSTGAVPVVISMAPQETGDVRVDVDSIAGSTDGLAAFLANIGQIYRFTVTNVGFTPTATEFEATVLDKSGAAVTEATANHFVDLVVCPTAGALAGKRLRINAYSFTGGRCHFTVTDKGEAFGNGDTGIFF